MPLVPAAQQRSVAYRIQAPLHHLRRLHQCRVLCLPEVERLRVLRIANAIQCVLHRPSRMLLLPQPLLSLQLRSQCLRLRH